MTDWISWETAAALTGIRVPTIEHAVRVGRIERRPRQGRRPSLRRDSVLAWAEWQRDVEKRRAQRRIERPPRGSRKRNPQTNPPDGWITTTEAAERVGKSRNTVGRWIKDGQLIGERHRGRWWVDPASLAAEQRRRSAWVSRIEAARIVGCSDSTIGNAVKRGDLVPRAANRSVPSLERAAVEAYRGRRAAEFERAATAGRPPPSAPPDDGRVWLSTAVVAIMLRVKSHEVSRVVRLGRLPGVKRGARVWVRRDHAEQAAAAREFATPDRPGRGSTSPERFGEAAPVRGRVQD